MKNKTKNLQKNDQTTKKSHFGGHFTIIQVIFVPHQTGYYSQKTNLRDSKPFKSTVFDPKSPIFDHLFTKYSLSHQPKLSIHQTWHSSCQIANLPQEAKS